MNPLHLSDTTLPLRAEESIANMTHIGPYRLDILLGRGGMGEVYKAVHTVTERVVALKVLTFPRAQLKQHLERMTREAMAMASLRHPHVVTCYSFGEDQDRLYLALELMSGGDTVGLLRRRGGELDEASIRSLTMSCVQGLSAIHRAGMVHRDIKPANILLDAGGMAKLADFGLACFHESAAGTRKRAGTPSYMPPESISGDQVADIRGDIYSLGVTMHYWATGQLPFVGATPQAILRQALIGEAPDLAELRPDLSPDLRRIITTAMHRDPHLRFQDPDSFARSLLGAPAAPAVRSDEPIPTSAPPPVEAVPLVPAAVPRHRVPWMVTAAVLLALGGGLLLISGRTVADDGKVAVTTAPAGPAGPASAALGVGYVFPWLGDELLHFTENGAVSYTRSGQRIHLGDDSWLEGGAAPTLTEALRSSGDLTIEMALRPDNLTQEGPAQILGLGLNARSANLAIGQSGTRLEVRLRTTVTNPDGTRPHLISDHGALTGAWQHVLFIREGTRNTLYVDGVRATVTEVGGDLSAWDTAYPWVVGNVHRGGFPWNGTLDRVVVRARAWSGDEIAAAHASWRSTIPEQEAGPVISQVADVRRLPAKVSGSPP